MYAVVQWYFAVAFVGMRTGFFLLVVWWGAQGGPVEGFVGGGGFLLCGCCGAWGRGVGLFSFFFPKVGWGAARRALF